MMKIERNGEKQRACHKLHDQCKQVDKEICETLTVELEY